MVASTFTDWSSWSQPWTELQQINQAAQEKMVRECISYCSDTTGTAIKCMQTMPRITGPEDYFNLNMKLMTQQSEKTAEFVNNIIKICQQAMADQYQWTEDKVGTTFNKKSKTKRESTDVE